MSHPETTTDAPAGATPHNLLDEADLAVALSYEPFRGDKGAPLDLRRLRNKIVTAAKRHPCHGCRGKVVIEIGERHRQLVEVSREDGIMSFRWCQLCLLEHGREMLGIEWAS